MSMMFDVSWSDPTRETVAQRRSRKEQEQKTVSSGASQITIRSDDAASGLRRPFPLTLLNSHRRDFARPLSRSKSSMKRPDSAEERPRNHSNPVSRAHNSPCEAPVVPLGKRSPSYNFFVADYTNTSNSPDSSPSIDAGFASWATQSINTDSTWSCAGDHTAQSHLVQPLSPTSFVSRSTEITVTSHNDLNADPKHTTVVEIYSDSSLPPPSPMQFPARQIPSPKPSLSASEWFNAPLPPTIKLSMPEVYVPKKNSSKIAIDEIIVDALAGHNLSNEPPSDTWKPPPAWNVPTEERSTTRRSPPPKPQEQDTRRPSTVAPVQPQASLSQLQRTIRRMIAAGPKIVLERLTEEWSEATTDASLFSELELEKQLWMLAALQPPDKKMLPRATADDQKVDVARSSGRKILSLYEDYASASYLSALNSTTQVYHLSTDPLSSDDYPNVHSFPVPSPTAVLPFAAGVFSSIQSFLLPALFPSSSIPTILKECHRTLAPTPAPFTKSSTYGALHLTILDPSPSPATMGTHLRTWLDTHLIVNLERQFRCINPCRLFPIWLADARLRGERSIVTSVRFAAATETAVVRSYNRGGDCEEETREELRSVVGRRLWEATWGRFIDGAGRWWDDAEIIEECVRMGTTWEYLIIEAVKEV